MEADNLGIGLLPGASTTFFVIFNIRRNLMSREYRDRKARESGNSSGRIIALQEFLEVILQHLMEGNNSSELQFDLDAKLEELGGLLKDLQRSRDSLRAETTKAGIHRRNYLQGRIEGIGNVSGSVRSVMEFMEKNQENKGARNV